MYRRYEATPSESHRSPHNPVGQAPPKTPVAPPPPPSHCHSKPHTPQSNGFLQKLLPSSLYNPETKKILGLFSAEDLLLIALIFIFLEDNNDDNPLLAIALIYVLLSDYIDLGDLGF